MTTAQTESAPDAPEALLEDPNSPLVIAGQILCVVLPLAVWFAPLPLAPATKHGFAIVGFMVVAWITRAMDYALAGFIGCFLFWALGIVKFPVAFSGFANDTAWFLFGALLAGRVATRSGVARRLAYFIIHAGHIHSAGDGVCKSPRLNPLLLGMFWTFAAGGKLFAYQSGVLIVGYSYGYFSARDLVRMGPG